MATYLAILLIYAGFSYTIPFNLLNALAIILLYIVFDLLWTYLRDKVWYLPVSSVISGCVLGIVSLPNPPLIWVALLPILAVLSKQLLHFGKMRHLFNPAAFALAVASFFFPAVTWWGTSWPIPALVVLALVSLFILWKQRRFDVALPFLIFYTIFLTLYLIWTGVPADGQLLYILNAFLINGTILFFTAVMLIEPMTSTFPTRRNRIAYGVFVAFYAIAVTVLLKFLPLKHLDPLIFGLLLGNLTASLIFLPNQPSKPTQLPAGN